MATGIQNFPNIIPADADYLDGDIKDAPSGTPVNRSTNGDIQQFFAKLLRVAGITPNGLRDNESNGYQLYDALTTAARPYDTYVAALTQTGTGDPTAVVMENTLGGTLVLARSVGGTYSATLVGAFDAAKTVGFISVQTIQRYGKITRFSDDAVLILIEDETGTLDDDWSAYVEIRVYR
jgi:hypothetical protein